MNFKEGTRRLAILIGALGAIAGGFASYVQLDNLSQQRARHDRFKHAVQSPAIRNLRRQFQTPLPPPGNTANQSVPVTPSTQGIATGSDEYTAPIPEGATIGDAHESRLKPGDPIPQGATIGNTPQASPDNSGVSIDPGSVVPLPGTWWDVNHDGIASVILNEGLKVKSIRMQDGEVLDEETAPNRWLYILAISFPAIGFFIPWISIRALLWTVAGFVEPRQLM